MEKFEVGPARVMCISWAMRMQQLYDADKAGRFATAETREEVNAGIQEEPEFQELAETGTAAVKAMRLYTDGKCALMEQTMDIEIGGALTDDTPPELSAEAS